MIDHNKTLGSTSYKQTSFGIISRTKLLPLELEGVKRGLEFIYHLIKENENPEINPQLICKLHSVSFEWIFPNWAGKFRTIQVTYSHKEAPSYFQINELIINLCADLKAQLKNLPLSTKDYYIDMVVKLLAWFQHKFVFIHPFQDYNGRTARMLTTLLLLKLNLPAIELSIKNNIDRKTYLKAMQQGDDGNLSLLENLISDALTKELNIK